MIKNRFTGTGPLFWILAAMLILAGNACYAGPWPRIHTYPQVNTNTVIADNATSYSVSTVISDEDGYNDIIDVRTLINFTEAGGVSTLGRGYLAWATSDAQITRYGGTWVIANAAGGGRWGYRTDAWGGTTYITPLGCSVTTSGSASGAVGTRTVTWTFRAKPAWANNPLINDFDVWASDASSHVIGWRDNPASFDVVPSQCAAYCSTPHPPVVGGATAGSVTVAIDPRDSNDDLFCIRVSPVLQRKEFVQADGTLGMTAFFQSKAAWGTTTVRGIPSNTEYAFTTRAMRTIPGYCPSAWSDPAIIATSVLERTIDNSAPGIPINKGIFGMDAAPKGGSAQLLADSLAVSYNCSMRYAFDGYNWKTRTAPGGANTQSTLQRLREARDRNSYLQLLINTRGIGSIIDGTWVYSDTSATTLAALAADWIYYCNTIVHTKRQGDPLSGRDQAIINSINWWYDPKLLAPGEALPPKVTYCEIGNEPEGPYPAPPLTPEEYAQKYKVITQALAAEDPNLKFGPSIMTAANGNAWLDAVLSDPTNRVDVVYYHPYGNLYHIVNSVSGGVLDAADLNLGINGLRDLQIQRRQEILDRLAANNRPITTGLIESEWNPSSWQGSYNFNLNRTMAHALGIADGIFFFAEYGYVAAQYWDHPNWPGSVIEAPGQKLYKMLQSMTCDRFLDSFVEPDFRLFSVKDTTTGRLMIWALNMSEDRDKTVRLQVLGLPAAVSVFQHRLAAVNGPTSLITVNAPNDPTENIVWTVTDLTGSVNPASFTAAFPRASITMLRFEPPLKNLPDGARVTVLGKSVTAVYPGEGYLYVEQDDRSYGVRVIGDCSGISVGDRVDVSGSIGTLKPDGATPSERVVNAESIVRLCSDAPLKPVGMTCRAVGGGPTHGTAGVNDAAGLNNVGLLVRITGRITEIVDTELMYVDDGSNVADVDGKTGVLVKCPDTSSFSLGSIVTVTGVVEGCVPEGWTTNRRYIRARTADDIVHVLP